MQKSQWHHCPHDNCDSKFKSKSDLKHHTEGHDALDSGNTSPCWQCDYIGKTPKRLADHKQVHKEHSYNFVGCNAVFNHCQKLLNNKKGESRRISFKVYCNSTAVSGFITCY